MSSHGRQWTDRKLVIVDIENLVGHPCPTRGDVDWVREKLLRKVVLQPGDQLVIGVSHVGLLEVGCNWPHVRYVVRSGKDGADLALLDVLDEDVASRFGRVVIASGDGIFADAATQLRLPIDVVSRRGGLSARLRLVANRVTYLTDNDDPKHFTALRSLTTECLLDPIDSQPTATKESRNA